jgi:hypothetical protein
VRRGGNREGQVLTPDIERYIARRFAASERDAALALVKAATIEDGSPAGTRLLRSAVVASGGSLETLRIQIEHLKIDWRDVIVAGEYVSRNGQLVRVRNLNEPIADEAP